MSIEVLVDEKAEMQHSSFLKGVQILLSPSRPMMFAVTGSFFLLEWAYSAF